MKNDMRAEQALKCRRLVASILGTAVIDAIRPMTGIKTRYALADAKRARRDALDWFVADGAWFREVCEIIGLKPDRIRRAVLSGDAGEALAEIMAARK